MLSCRRAVLDVFSIAPVLSIAVGCATSTPSPEPPTNTDANPPASEGVDTTTTPTPEAQPAAALSDPAEAPEAEPEAEPATGASEGAAPPGLSDGETRTMKVIQQTILDNRDRFRACYDRVQARVPELQGDLTLYFVLDSRGKVKEAQLNEKRSTLKHEDVVKCAIEEVKDLKFPESSKGLETKVNYPFNFNPR